MLPHSAAGTDFHLHARQASDPCLTNAGPCSWLFPILECVETDTACICRVVTSGSLTQSNACITCEQSYNATFAAEIVVAEQQCLALATSPGQPTPTPATPTPVPPTTDTCLSATGACAFLAGLNACATTDLPCICRVFTSAGSARLSTCISCEQVHNVTLANEIATVGQQCLGPAGTTSAASPTATVDPCLNGPCTWLRGISSCAESDTACFCRVFNQAGAAGLSSCLSCEQTVNRTFASEIAFFGSSCPSSTAPVGGNTFVATVTPSHSTTPAAGTVVSMATSAFGKAFSAVGFIILLNCVLAWLC